MAYDRSPPLPKLTRLVHAGMAFSLSDRFALCCSK